MGNRALARHLAARRAGAPASPIGRRVLQRDPILTFSDNWRPDMDLANPSYTAAQIQAAVVHVWNAEDEEFWSDMDRDVAEELLDNSAFEPVLTGLRRLGYHALLNALHGLARDAPQPPAANPALNAWIAGLTFEQATTDKFRADHVAEAAATRDAIAEARARRGEKPASTLLVLSAAARAALTAEVQELNRTIAREGERDTRALFRLTQAPVAYVSAYPAGRTAFGTTRFWYTVKRDGRDTGWSMHHLDALHETTATQGSEAREDLGAPSTTRQPPRPRSRSLG
jgi:hypothetical protein